MANPIIRIKRGSSTPANGVLSAGELAVDLTNKNLFVGLADGSALPIGGEGTFATKDYVTNVTGSLGTMSQQNADSVAITGGTIDGVGITMGTVFGTNLQTVAIGSSSYIADSTIENTPIGATTPSTGAFTTLTASSAPSASNDVVRKTDLDARISSLGTIFKYIGTLDGGVDEASAYDLGDLNVGGGEFYRVATAGFFAGAGGPNFYANQGDGILFDIDGASEHIDNTNTQVAGTANEIAVSGSTDTGYTVAIDSAFSGRVSTAETDIDDLQTKTQNIDLAGTTAGTTAVNGTIAVGGFIESAVAAGLGLSGNFIRLEASADIIFKADSNGIVLGGQYAGATPSTLNIECRHNLVGVNDPNNSTMMNIENFVIDGGVY
jgi:hypothetical protein